MKPTVLKENIIFQNLFVTVYNERIILPNGSKTDHVKIKHPATEESQSQGVIVLPVTKDGKIVLIKEYYYGINEHLYILPRGNVEEKDIENAAERELREETGYTTKRMRYVQRFIENPRVQNHVTHAFLAYDAEYTQPKKKNKNDVIEGPFLFTKEQIEKMCSEGLIIDSVTLLVLNMYLSKM